MIIASLLIWETIYGRILFTLIRQTTSPAARCGAANSGTDPVYLRPAPDCSIPVSYTHLDVYKRQRYIAGILYPRETTDTDVDTRAGESEQVPDPESEDPGVEPARRARATPEFLENAEELINRSKAYRQSAISITVAIKSEDNIRVKVSAGTYTCLLYTSRCV